MAAFRKAVCEAVSEQDVREVAARLVEQAKEGDVAAAKLVLAYTVGRPQGAVDPDTLDQQEWQLFRQGPARPDDLSSVLDNMPASTACTLLRPLVPALEESWAHGLADRLRPDEPAPDRRTRKKKRKKRRR
jgi:hypothetical protein